MDAEAVRRLGIDPVPGESPSGRNARMEPAYQAVQEEIEKLSSMTGAGKVDWRAVVSGAAEVLGVSKDLTSAAYLAAGLMETEGLPALAEGADLLAGLIDNFWEGLFPEIGRMRARKNAIDWWEERAKASVRKQEGPIGFEARERMAESLANLDRSLGARDLAPIRELRSMVASLEATAPPAAPADPAADSAAAASAPAGSVPTAAAAPPADAEEAAAALVRAADAYLALAGPPTTDDPWRWRISRLKSWLGLKKPPPAEGTRTMLPEPPAEALKSIAAMIGDGRAAQALAAAEDLCGVHIFWLDAQKASFDALQALGMAVSARALQSEAAGLVDRWPALLSLTFDGGTPLASEAVRAWLKSGADAGGAAGLSPAEAYRKMAEGDPVEALTRLSRPDAKPADGRAALAKTAVEAGLWVKVGRPLLAAGLADHLTAAVELLDLAAFDPILAAEALRAAHEAYAAAGPASAAKAVAAAAKLAVLNPESALALPPDGGF